MNNFTDEFCVINPKSWRSCQKCRFDKCIRSGMKPEAVLTRDQRRVRNVKRKVMKKIRLDAKMPFEVNSLQMSSDEETQLTSVIRFNNQKYFQNYCILFQNEPATYISVLRVCLFGQNLGLKNKQALDQFCRTQDVLKFWALEDMKPLPENIRHHLLCQNLPLVAIVRDASLLSDVDCQFVTSRFRQIITPKDTDYNLCLSIFNEFKQLKLTNADKDKGIADYCVDYNHTFVSPWAPNVEMEKRFKSLLTIISKWIRSSPDELKDDTLVSLLELVMLFMPVNLSGEYLHKVENIQAKYLELLYRYLKHKSSKNHSVSRQKLATAIQILSVAREAADIKSKMCY